MIVFWAQLSASQIVAPCLIPSLKLTFFASENWWLEDEVPFGTRPILRGELLVSGSGIINQVCGDPCIHYFDHLTTLGTDLPDATFFEHG